MVWRTQRRFRAGPGRLAWRPARATPPRTYVLRLTALGRGGRRTIDNARPGIRRAPVVRVQGVVAGFPLRSYAPGEPAPLTVATDAREVRLQVFHYSSERGADFKTAGTAKTAPLALDWSSHRDAPAALDFVRAGDWPSGLYFLRASAGDGRLGYAPFIVRPKSFGATSRIAVVLATNTWQAYNFWDADGDGWGDSWYVSGSVKSVDLRRPYLDFGVPFRFRDWDLDFIGWLNRTDKRVEFLSDDDLERFANGDELARAYDLIVFPGHEEYVTKRAYDLVQRYRDRGGNLLFLAANNFFWRVDREGERLAPRAGLARAPPAGVGARRRAVRRLGLRRPPGGLRRGAGRLAVRGHRAGAKATCSAATGSRSTPARPPRPRARACWRRSRTCWGSGAPRR